MCMEFTVVCNRVYLHKVYVHFDSLVIYIYTCTSLRMQSKCISPLCKIYGFCSQWWQPKDPKTHGVFVALCRPPYGFPKQGTSPALSLGGTMCQGWFMGWETRVENPRETHTKTNRKGLKNGAWKNHEKPSPFLRGVWILTFKVLLLSDDADSSLFWTLWILWHYHFSTVVAVKNQGIYQHPPPHSAYSMHLLPPAAYGGEQFLWVMHVQSQNQSPLEPHTKNTIIGDFSALLRCSMYDIFTYSSPISFW